MKWHSCIDSAEQLVLELCRGSMNEGDGDGCDYSNGYSDGEGDGHGYSIGFRYGWGDGEYARLGDGDGKSKSR